MIQTRSEELLGKDNLLLDFLKAYFNNVEELLTSYMIDCDNAHNSAEWSVSTFKSQ